MMDRNSGAFDVDDAEGAALISAGVAEPCESEVKSAKPTGSGGAAGGTPSEDGDRNGAEVVSDEDQEIQCENAETVDYLTLTAAELRGLCDERGIPYKKNAGVKALAALLAADDEKPLPEVLPDDDAKSEDQASVVYGEGLAPGTDLESIVPGVYDPVL